LGLRGFGVGDSEVIKMGYYPFGRQKGRGTMPQTEVEVNKRL